MPHLFAYDAVDTIATNDNMSHILCSVFANTLDAIPGMLYVLGTFVKKHFLLVPEMMVQCL
jgi:hypothetical protein